MKNMYKSVRGEIFNLFIYFSKLKVTFLVPVAIIGFIVFIVYISQLITGAMLALGFLSETMIIPLSRDEEDLENLYTDDFFWLHERGVDILVISCFGHLLRKIYLNIMNIEQEVAWKSGIFIFLLSQLVIFAGLVLCDTHLSDITLVIAANALHTFFMFIGKFYWVIFPDKTLNCDTLLRVTYIHYLFAMLVIYLGCTHGVDMHYDWKPKAIYSGINQQMCWWDEVLINEIGKLKDILLFTCICADFIFIEPDSLNYEIFMWGDVGMVVDVRFYGVAPHWYFRPYMAWLIACPYHYIGIFGLMFFFLVLYFQTHIFGNSELQQYKVINNESYWNIFDFLPDNSFIRIFLYKRKIRMNYRTYWNTNVPGLNIYWELSIAFFIIAVLYTTSYLPYGRFYNKLGGNLALLAAYFYIFSYLIFLSFRHHYQTHAFRLNILS